MAGEASERRPHHAAAESHAAPHGLERSCVASVGMNRRLSAQYDQYRSPGSESGHCLRYADAIQAIEHGFSKNDISRVTYGWNTSAAAIALAQRLGATS